ncbi:MAG: DNA-processing protein DprA [Pararhodobacter sp.]|nr:DNA-processing protein DprA [Pararhodobacter sp.]
MDGNSTSSPTPFTPPTTEEERLSWFRLIRSRRVGPSTFARLMREHGCATAALDALPAIARAAGIDDYTPCPADAAKREISAGLRAGAWPLFQGEDAYPAALVAIADPPPVLWVRGQADLLARPMVAMVGARNASSLGGRMARKLAEGLGWHGHVVVSGLARGIDTAVHGAALKTGTLAVMAGGVDVIYPAENAALAAAIADQGILLSEQPIGTQPQARHFPRRNRIVSGLSQAVVVIEAAEGSGSLITAREALEQGREVLAVPGHPLDARAAGCNHLIREGARLVRDVADIVEALTTSPAHFDCVTAYPAGTDVAARAARDNAGGAPRMRGAPVPANAASPGTTALARNIKATAGPADAGMAIANPAEGDIRDAAATGAPAPNGARACQPQGQTSPTLPDTLTLHRLILDKLGSAPLAEDQLIRDLAIPAASVAPALLFLELDGRIQRQPGGMLARL